MQSMLLEINWTDEWQAIGSGVSAIIGVIGFIFLYVQVKQINNTIKSQNHSSIYQLGVETNKLLIENSHLMPYFLGEKPLVEKSNEYYQCISICESILDLYEFIYLEKNRIDSDLLDNYMTLSKKIYKKNVVLQHYLQENKDNYQGDFVKMILESN